MYDYVFVSSFIPHNEMAPIVETLPHGGISASSYDVNNMAANNPSMEGVRPLPAMVLTYLS